MLRALALASIVLVSCSGGTGSGGSGGGAATGGSGATGGGSGGGGGGSGGGSAGGSAAGGGSSVGGGFEAFDAGPTGTATLTGALAFTVRDARAVVRPLSDGGMNLSQVQIGLASVLFGNFCDGTGVNGEFQALTLGVEGNAAGVMAQAYPITDPSMMVPGTSVAAFFDYLAVDGGQPMLIPPLKVADGGTVTLSNVANGHLVGTFSVGIDGAPLSGSFDAPFLVCQ